MARPGSGTARPVRDALNDGEEVKAAARQAVDARHCHHVARGKVFQEPEKLAPVGLRPTCLLSYILLQPSTFALERLTRRCRAVMPLSYPPSRNCGLSYRIGQTP